MLLSAASHLVGFGLLLFALGYLFEYYGLSALGGIVIVGAGAQIATEGLFVDVDGSLQEVVFSQHFDLGFLVLIIGALVMLQSFNNYNERPRQ